MRRKLFNIAAALSILPLGLLLTSSVHWYAQPHSDFYSTFLYGSPTSQTSFAISNVFHVHHRTTAGDSNTRYASAGATLDWRAFGFSFRLMRLANYPRLLYPRAA